MKLSREMKLIIAKSGSENRWLPLWIHAMDTASVMEELIHLRYSSLSEVCGISFSEFKRTAVLLAYLHDIGKITPLFQSQILKSLPARHSLFEHYGIHNISENFINKDKSHHTKCGEVILLNQGFPEGLSSVIGAHHGMPAEDLFDHIEKYPDHFWGILLIVSDWVASDQTNFEWKQERIKIGLYLDGNDPAPVFTGVNNYGDHVPDEEALSESREKNRALVALLGEEFKDLLIS